MFERCYHSVRHFSPINLAIVGLFEYDELAISQRRVKIQDVVDYGAHLLGQHTVRLSPIGFVCLSSLAFFELIILFQCGQIQS